MRGDNEKKKINNVPITLTLLLCLWAAVLVLIAVALAVFFTAGDGFGGNAFSVCGLIVSFASFAATSFFGISIYNHNVSIRDTNDEARRKADLQFAASNYTVADFVEHISLYEEYGRYVDKLKKTEEYDIYMVEDGVDRDKIRADEVAYSFVTVRIPLKVIEGKAIGQIRFSRFKFETEGGDYKFIPARGAASNSLIIFNEEGKRSEVVINLIAKKDGGFYRVGAVTPFLKIKASITMESLLGVAVHGAVELYFVNPEKPETDGSSKYKITSTRFKASGLPALTVNSGGKE